LTLLVAAMAPLAYSVSENRGSDPGPHPLKVLKVVREINQGEAGMGQTRGTMEIWLQNSADVDVDKVKMEVEIFTRDGRFLDKVKKDIGVIKAGSKSYQTVRWSVIGNEQSVKQKIWLFYNGGKEKLTQFEAEPPTWQ
jgi:hypothetical protein